MTVRYHAFLRGGVQLVPREHRSEFGSYPIKYEGHRDAQYLALWLGESTPNDTGFLCLHPNIMSIIAERPAGWIPLTHNRRKMRDAIRESNAEYVLADRSKTEILELLIPAIEEFPAGFEPVIERPGATLYRVISR